MAVLVGILVAFYGPAQWCKRIKTTAECGGSVRHPPAAPLLDRPFRLGLLSICFAIQALCASASVAQTRGAQAPLGVSEVVGVLLAPPDAAWLDAGAAHGAPETAPVQVRNRRRQAIIGGTIGGLAGALAGMGAGALAEGYDGEQTGSVIGLGVGAVVGATIGAVLGHFYTSERSPR